MNKKKKVIIIAIIAIVVIAAISVGGYFLLTNLNKNSESDKEQSQEIEEGQEQENEKKQQNRISKVYDTLKDKGVYQFSIVMDENNKEIFAKKQEQAYLEIVDEGEKTRYIIRDGNTYLLQDSRKICFEYTNNIDDLNKIEDELKKIIDKDVTTGKEKVNGKKYDYEEYGNIRYYFKKDELVFIKYLDTEKVYKIEISYNNIDNNMFKLPADYEIR